MAANNTHMAANNKLGPFPMFLAMNMKSNSGDQGTSTTTMWHACAMTTQKK